MLLHAVMNICDSFMTFHWLLYLINYIIDGLIGKKKSDHII